jgi:hypothetical protein
MDIVRIVYIAFFMFRLAGKMARPSETRSTYTISIGSLREKSSFIRFNAARDDCIKKGT